MMKEKPIIFSTEMVKAILADRKTKTRRLNGLKEINENPDQWDLQSFEVNPELMAWDKNGDCYPRVKKGLIATFENNELGEVYRNIKCPWEVGDVLWVRETWAIHDLILKPKKLNPNDEAWFYKRKFSPEMVPHVVYAADYPVGSWKGAWRSPRFMPKVAARLFLKVKDIRVERLQGITEEDARAEGITYETAMECSNWGPSFYDPDSGGNPDYIEAFKILWDSINFKRGYGWDLNPFVWIVEFERVEK